MSSRTRWPWVWVNSGSWRQTGRPGVLRSMGLQSHNWATELTWAAYAVCPCSVTPQAPRLLRETYPHLWPHSAHMYHSNDFFLAPFPTNPARIFQNQTDLRKSVFQATQARPCNQCHSVWRRKALGPSWRRGNPPHLSSHSGGVSSRLGPPVILSHRAGSLPPHEWGSLSMLLWLGACASPSRPWHHASRDAWLHTVSIYLLS